MQLHPFEPKPLCSVKEAAKTYRNAFSEASFRWLIFNEKTNGFSSCVRRIGRKVLIDLDAFESWIAKQGDN